MANSEDAEDIDDLYCQMDDLSQKAKMLEAANEIDEVQSKENDGRGIVCVEIIVHYLRQGNYNSALNVRRIDGDKTRMHKEVEKVLYKWFGCLSHGHINCQNSFCKSVNQ